ncbi:MAG: photosystem II protein PsbQ [Microcystaceae cyanobacterium]
MSRFRSLLSIILILVTTLLVSCSSPSASKVPTTYSAEKIEQLQMFIEPVVAAQEQMEILRGFIAEKNWVDTRTYIHGPLGQVRLDMANLNRSLLPKDQKVATNAAKEFLGHLERIDAAAKERNTAVVQSQFSEALKDLSAYLNLLPKA